MVELMIFPNSTYPALTIFQYRSINLWSSKCLRNSFSRTWKSILSKKDLMSPSINHLIPFQYLISARAEWHPLAGLNPWDLGENLLSRIVSRTALTASCTILSLGGAIPRGLIFPLALGMYTLLVGLKLYCSLISCSEVVLNHSLDIPSRVSLSEPGVMLPGADFIFMYADCNTRELHTMLYALLHLPSELYVTISPSDFWPRWASSLGEILDFLTLVWTFLILFIPTIENPLP
uniref:Uncharacterized protein n=1 Tax=Juglanconis juglandina TaxID=1940567 RepID=A0A291LJE1_9PEZI|nr:hypothetical protein [Juglanconis juglandina]